MEKYIGILLIVISCTAVLLVGSIKRKAEWLLNIILRSILGTITIYFVNLIFSAGGISTNIGINWITVLTTGILGFPGVAVLYGIGIYQML